MTLMAMACNRTYAVRFGLIALYQEIEGLCQFFLRPFVSADVVKSGVGHPLPRRCPLHFAETERRTAHVHKHPQPRDGQNEYDERNKILAEKCQEDDDGRRYAECSLLKHRRTPPTDSVLRAWRETGFHFRRVFPVTTRTGSFRPWQLEGPRPFQAIALSAAPPSHCTLCWRS